MEMADPGDGALVRARPNHLGLVVADIEAQIAWYGRVFGLREITGHRPMPTIRTALLQGADGLQIEMIKCAGSRRHHHFADAQEAAFVEGYAHWAIDVDDLAEAYAALLGAGATTARAPSDGPAGFRFAYIKDPEGNLIELIEDVAR